MVAPAPALFSTTTGCPSFLASVSLMILAVMSAPPPGANGTTILNGLFGNGGVSPACAPVQGNKAAITDEKGKIVFILSPREVVYWWIRLLSNSDRMIRLTVRVALEGLLFTTIEIFRAISGSTMRAA